MPLLLSDLFDDVFLLVTQLVVHKLWMSIPFSMMSLSH